MKEVISKIFGLVKIDLGYFPNRMTHLLWRFYTWYNQRLLEGNATTMARYLNYEYFKKTFVTKYMDEQGYSIPAITKVVLRNGYNATLAIHFFNPDHMVIDRENSIVKPVYTADLLQTDYYLDKEISYE
jgi:hypothetical protein